MRMQVNKRDEDAWRQGDLQERMSVNVKKKKQYKRG